MKPSYFVSRLLRPAFAALTAITLATSISASVGYAATVTGQSYNKVTSDVDSIELNLTVPGGSSDYTVYGVNVTGASTLGAVKLDLTVTASAADASAYGVKNSNSTITSIATSGDDVISVTSDYGLAFGIDNSENTGTETKIDSIDATIIVSAGMLDEDYYYYTNAYGIWNTQGAEIGSVAGSISAESLNDNAFGIYNENASIGSIKSKITATSTYGWAVGIGNYSDGDITSIDADITANSSSGSALGVENNAGTIGSINGSITVEEASSYAMGVGNYSSGEITSIDSEIDVTGKYARAINNESGTIGSISGILTATGTSTTYAIYNTDTITGSVTGSITAISTGSSAYGVYNKAGTVGGVGDEDTSIIVSAKSSAYGVYNTGTITDGVTASIDVSTSSTSSSIYGIYNTKTMGDVEADITASATSSGTVYGIRSSSSIGDITADIDVINSGSGKAYGLYLSSTVGDINANIIAKTEGSGDVYGMYLSSVDADFTGTIDASSTSGVSYGINLYSSSARTLTIAEDSSISSTTYGSSNAFGIYSSTTKGVTITLEDGLSVTATAYDDSASATAILSTGNLTIAAEGDVSISAYTTGEDVSTRSIYAIGTASLGTTGTLNLTGDIQVDSGASAGDYAGSLTISSGTVALSEGSTIMADTVTIDSGATLSLVIDGNNTISSTSVTGSGNLILSAGTDLEANTYYFTSASEESGYEVVGSDITVTTYGGTLSGNIFTVSKALELTLDGDTLEGDQVISVTENARVVVSSSDASGDSTTIVMNFNTSASDLSTEITTTISAVTTVTSVTDIATGLTVTESFEEFVTKSTEDTILASAAYYFDVDLTEGDSVLLVFEVGEMSDDVDIAVFHLDENDGSWSDADALDSSSYYYSDGNLYVTVEGFSAYGYSITAKGASDGSIPEPSTATLSLLALAGLCARRRRKA